MTAYARRDWPQGQSNESATACTDRVCDSYVRADAFVLGSQPAPGPDACCNQMETCWSAPHLQSTPAGERPYAVAHCATRQRPMYPGSS